MEIVIVLELGNIFSDEVKELLAEFIKEEIGVRKFTIEVRK